MQEVVNVDGEEYLDMEMTDELCERLIAIEHELKVTFAQTLKPLIEEEIHTKCYGCDLIAEDGERFDHPSQLHHNVCVMMDLEEQIELCFDSAMDRLDYDKVYVHWLLKLDQMSPKPSFEEYGFYTLSHEHEWFTDEFKEQVKTFVLTDWYNN